MLLCCPPHMKDLFALLSKTHRPPSSDLSYIFPQKVDGCKKPVTVWYGDLNIRARNIIGTVTMTIIGDDTRLNVLATDESHHRPCCGRIEPQCDRTYNTYFISDGKIRIIRVRKNGLKYVKIRLIQFIIYKHSLTNNYRKLVNVIVSCFQVYGKASRGL